MPILKTMLRLILQTHFFMSLGMLSFILGCFNQIPRQTEQAVSSGEVTDPFTQQTIPPANDSPDQDESERSDHVTIDPVLQAALVFASEKMYVWGSFGVPNGLGIPPDQILEHYKILRKERDSRVHFYFWESQWADEFLRDFHEQYPGCPKERELEFLPTMFGGFPLYFRVTVDENSTRIVGYYASIK